MADLFPSLPRRARRKLMHVIDAGSRGRDLMVRFACARCGHQSDWTRAATITEAKRGKPCPTCEAGDG